MQQWRTFLYCLIALVIVASGIYPFTPAHAAASTEAPVDADKDGLPDAWEAILSTDPNNPDTDGDGYNDGLEVRNSYDPLDVRPIKKEKLIKVSIKEQKLRYFFDGKQLEEFLVSTGLKQTPTPTGEFSVLQKRPVVHFKGTLLGRKYNYPNTKWNLAFKKGPGGSNYYIHGAYWHNEFGKRRSAGCVNVPYAHMETLYNFADLSTKVVIE